MQKKYTYFFIFILSISLVGLNSCAPSADLFAVDTTNNSDGIYSSSKENQIYNYNDSYYNTNDIENIAGDPSLGLYEPNDSTYNEYLRNKYLNDETAEAYYNVDTTNLYYVEGSDTEISSNSYNSPNQNIYSPYGISIGIGMGFGYPGYGYGRYPGYGYGGYPGYGYGYGGYPGYGFGGYPGYGYGGYPGYFPGRPIYPGIENPIIKTNTKRNSKAGTYSSTNRNSNGIKYTYKPRKSISKKSNNSVSTSNNSKTYSKYRGNKTRRSNSNSNNSYYKKSNSNNTYENSNTRSSRSYNSTPSRSSSRSSGNINSIGGSRSTRRTR